VANKSTIWHEPTSCLLASSTRTSIARSNEDGTYIHQNKRMSLIFSNTKITNKTIIFTCKELNTKLRSGCVGNESRGISEKQPARTWVQEAKIRAMIELLRYNIKTCRKSELTQLNKQRRTFLFLSCSWTPPSEIFWDCSSRNSRTIGVCERSCFKGNCVRKSTDKLRDKRVKIQKLE